MTKATLNTENKASMQRQTNVPLNRNKSMQTLFVLFVHTMSSTGTAYTNTTHRNTSKTHQQTYFKVYLHNSLIFLKIGHQDGVHVIARIFRLIQFTAHNVSSFIVLYHLFIFDLKKINKRPQYTHNTI